MLELVGLFGHGLGPVHITVAKAVDADAAGEIQILLALRALGVQAVALLPARWDCGYRCAGRIRCPA